ncbi:MAG TPA: DNA-directed RNA polymerase subunit beta [Dehalococcoidia bacterium]|nr:DNA-directed RNA polymerase subunit beta [Dehalococcoidia bacterium]
MSTLATSDKSNGSALIKKSFAKLPEVLETPNLIKVQLDSFRLFQEESLKELLEEVSPITDYSGNKLELRFLDYEFRKPPISAEECLQKDLTYESPLYIRTELTNKQTGEIKRQEIFLGKFPLMTKDGTFVISGAERVIVNQLLRSPGIYFSTQRDISRDIDLCSAKLIPEHGTWLEFETSNRDVLSVKVNGKRKIPVVTLLRAIGYDSDEQLIKLFSDVDNAEQGRSFIQATIDREPKEAKTKTGALADIFSRLRPGDLATPENAQALLYNLFFNPRRYNLGKVGRYKLNKRLNLDIPETEHILKAEDFVEIIRHMIMINNGNEEPDDIDHLGNRRVRTAGHLIQNQFRIGLLRLEQTIKERMSTTDPEQATPTSLINNRPITAAMREFFCSSQLSQFMDQTNPLAELTHKRRLSAMGPGGLSRERASFDVRDVHHSHYGKICPIETPEGPNIGLIGSLATYASVNEYGFIQTPYRKVVRSLRIDDPDLKGKTINERIADKKDNTIVQPKTIVTEEILKKLRNIKGSGKGATTREVKVVPYVSSEIIYLTADKEEQYAIAQANAMINNRNEFIEERVGVIKGGKYLKLPADKIDMMDVSPRQVFSVTTSLIPFLEHDDANRALMGSNMQRQAVPLLTPEAPIIGTGMEREVAKYSGQVQFAREDGEVVAVTSKEIVIKETHGKKETKRSYPLIKFHRTNQGTCVNQIPTVFKGQKVKKGQPIADGSATSGGELALGQNIMCAFMTWRGYNFEDAIILSQRLVKDDKFTSIHIERYEIEARETKLGREEMIRDIPNVGEESLRDLDEYGIIRIGAEVKPGDILVGKISPKGETELTAEEKLLRAIFGEKAREVKDSSLRVPHGEWGKVIDVKEFTKEAGDDLPAGVIRLVRVWVAQKRKISVGDKMAGRHGNKGVVSIIVPEEDMPFLPDERPIDIILNPIGVPSRMNIGQILETHLGWAADNLGVKMQTPIFDGANNTSIEDYLGRAWIVRQSQTGNRHEAAPTHDKLVSKAKKWLADRGYDAEKIFSDDYPGEARKACLRLWFESMGIKVCEDDEEKIKKLIEQVYLEKKQSPPIYGKMTLYDGRTGEPFDQPVTVGNIYMLKLIHLVDDKVHARSTGPYSLITQQPLGGKAQFGGQRFGEMEVWALEAYGAGHILQELLTVKSDDIIGRSKTYEALVKGEDITQPGIPESFKVLFMELRSLSLAVELLNEEEELVPFFDEKKKPKMLDI